MMKHKKKRNLFSPHKAFRYYPDQSWSCTGCGKCCSKMWDVPVTEKEKECIEKLIIPGFDFKNEEYFTQMKKHSNLFLIKKKNDKCVFLDTDGLCIIHKLHGEAVKALACRLYPFHILKWEDGVVSASFRFDCTAVSRNHGRKMSEQEKEISRFVPELANSGRKSHAAYNRELQPPLKNLREIASSYIDIIFDEEFKLSARLHYAASMINFYSMRKHSEYIVNIKPEFRKDTLAYLKENGEGFEYLVSSAEPMDKLTKMIFNYIISGYARVDEETGSGLLFSGRIKRAVSILKFMTDRGSLKKLGKEYSETKGFSTIDTLQKSVLEWEAKEIIKRYAAVQLESLHFCGPPGLNLTFEEGIRHLILFIPITIAVASLHAASRKGMTSNTKLLVSDKDMIEALMITDHTFYRSMFFKLRHVRKMEKWLTSEKRFSSILKLIE